MPDETTKTVTIDGVTWTYIHEQDDRPNGWPGGWVGWYAEPDKVADNDMHGALDRIAVLEKKIARIEAALQAFVDDDCCGGPDLSGPTRIDELLTWHRGRQNG